MKTALSNKLTHLLYVLFNEELDELRSITKHPCNYLPHLYFIQELSLTIMTFPLAFPSALFKQKIIL
jgi:hypothetical protein